MGKKKSKSRKNHLTTAEILIKEKAKRLIQAMKGYWEEQDKLHGSFNKVALSFESLPNEELFPKDLSSVIWIFPDGAVFLRYKTEGSIKGAENLRIFTNVDLNSWTERGLVIPFKGKDIIIPGFKIKPASNVTFVRTKLNDISIEYANYLPVRYDQPQLTPTLSKALLDFQFTVMGMIFQTSEAAISIKTEFPIRQDEVVAKLHQKVAELKKLLSDEVNEEDLQTYLKQNPFLLKPASIVIPKKKLGEDFVTDFVIVNILDQGSVYTLVELEKSSHPILTQNNELTAFVYHAIKQTRDWDIWLENNKSYLQGKLPGFEAPKYLILLGRTQGLEESKKAYLRSYNREFKNISILSYDDLITQTEEFLKSLQHTIG